MTDLNPCELVIDINELARKAGYLTLAFGCFEGSGSARPGTNSVPESTRSQVNSAGSTRRVCALYCLELCLYMFKSLLEYRKSILEILSADCDKIV